MAGARLLPCSAALLTGMALAHATLVFGTVTFDPDPPPTGSPFVIELSLNDPSGAPVEDAFILADFEGADGEVVSVRLTEGDEPGFYRGEPTLEEAGPYDLTLRDQTFRQEEAIADLEIEVGGDEPLGTREVIFPPTATGSGLTVWLAWLIGLPLLAGLLVTVLVLTGNRGKEEGD